MLTRRSGLSVFVMNDLVSSVMHNMTFAAFQKKLLEAHRANAMSLERGYVGAVNALLQQHSSQTRLQQDQDGSLAIDKQQKQFYTWSEHLYADEDSKRGRFPSVSWLIERWHDYSNTRAQFMDHHMMVCLGKYVETTTHIPDLFYHPQILDDRR